MAAVDYSQLEFPILWIGQKMVCAFVDLEHLRTCNRVVLTDRSARGVIVDKTLVCRDVKSTRVAGYIPPFWGFRLPGTRMLWLDYDLASDCRRISLDELKIMIIGANRASGMYRDMAASPRSYEASIQRRLQSFDEIIAQFRIGPKRGWLRWFWAGALD